VRPGVRRGWVADTPGVRASLVPSDLVNHGLVEDSVLFPGVRIGAGARVRRSVVLPGAAVPAGVDIDSAVVLEDGHIQQVTEGVRA
jgi:valienol-1-phosphate guanylyltransferase